MWPCQSRPPFFPVATQVRALTPCYQWRTCLKAHWPRAFFGVTCTLREKIDPVTVMWCVALRDVLRGLRCGVFTRSQKSFQDRRASLRTPSRSPRRRWTSTRPSQRCWIPSTAKPSTRSRDDTSSAWRKDALLPLSVFHGARLVCNMCPGTLLS